MISQPNTELQLPRLVNPRCTMDDKCTSLWMSSRYRDILVLVYLVATFVITYEIGKYSLGNQS